MLNKPYSESCDQNREPIGEVLDQFITDRKTVLEIGSGSGQHAVYFSAKYPFLLWQTSDLSANHSGIQAWIDDSQLDNVLAPIELDATGKWPDKQYDLLYSANTVHIMSSYAVEKLFYNIPECMHDDSVFLLYGPFNYQGKYTSDSNARFDNWLKQRNPESGIKNFEWLQDIARQSALRCTHDFTMPENNRLLVWQKDSLTAGN